MNKFPKEAEPVRRYIRDNVKRPKDLPVPDWADNTKLRWSEKCPLGLCPLATHDYPFKIGQFSSIPPFTEKQMEQFINFWDSATDPQYAVDQVWGE